MRRKATVHLLQEIAGIRSLQRAASENEAARASAALAEKSQALEHGEAERALDEKHWQDLMRAANLDPGMISLWTGVVARRDATVRRASSEMKEAETARDGSLSNLRAAEQRNDTAKDMAHRALREHLRDLEKDALQDATDHHLQRRRQE